VAFDAEENTIRFGIMPGNIRVAVNILAKELGYYEEEGVNVEFVDIQDATSALTSISANKTELDVWGVSIVPSLTFIANGSDLVIFEGTAAEGGAIISTPENVDYYKDLNNYQNITAAMVRNESSWLITRAKLLEMGLDVDSITLMEVDSAANVAQAVAKGEADLGFLPTERANSFLDIGISIVYEAGELDPMYVCCRQVTSSQKYEEKYDAFVKYAAANLRALEYYEDEANRDAVISLLAEYSGQTEEYVNNYLFVNRTFLTQDPNQSGVIKFYQSLADTGYFEEGSSADIADHIDISAYKQALDLLLERDPDDTFFQEQLEVFETYNA
jgi:NitT/TauT family transport system substrate-binding protein